MLVDRKIQITIEPRKDGGLRVYSDDLLGLILSGSDQRAVLQNIGTALIGLREHRRKIDPCQGAAS